MSLSKKTLAVRDALLSVPDNKQAAALKKKMERLFNDNPRLAVAVASQVMLKHLSVSSQG